MSKESRLFLQELQDSTIEVLGYVQKLFSDNDFTSSDLLGGNINENDVNTLRTISLDEKQLRALGKLVIAISRISMIEVLSLIDGIVMDSRRELPDLSLISLETGKDIADECLLNEDFYNYFRDID
jgi:hypothetical protein